MILFLDASALVKRYIEEPSSDEVREHLAETRPVVSRLSQVELSSALSRRAREGSVTLAERRDLLARLHRDLEAFDVVELVEAVASHAEDLLARHPLRSNDAIQLASCLQFQAALGRPVRFFAFDARLNEAASAEGLECRPFSNVPR